MKKQQVQHTVSSPVPSDFIGLPYSPALLLDARLDASITDDPGFHDCCKLGFEVTLACGEIYTVADLVGFVHTNMVTGGDDGIVMSFPFNVGVVLGGLSAVALSQYREAKEGLKELYSLIDRMDVE